MRAKLWYLASVYENQIKLFAISVQKLIRAMGHPTVTCRARCDFSIQYGHTEFGVAVFEGELRHAVKFWNLNGVSNLTIAAMLASWLNENRPSASIPTPF